MKAKIEFTFATKQFENIKPTLDIDIAELDGKELKEVYEFFERFAEEMKGRNIKVKKAPKQQVVPKYKLLQAQKDGEDIDNNPYLGTDRDRHAELMENLEREPNIAQKIASGERNS